MMAIAPVLLILERIHSWRPQRIQNYPLDWIELIPTAGLSGLGLALNIRKRIYIIIQIIIVVWMLPQLWWRLLTLKPLSQILKTTTVFLSLTLRLKQGNNQFLKINLIYVMMSRRSLPSRARNNLNPTMPSKSHSGRKPMSYSRLMATVQWIIIWQCRLLTMDLWW